jgi:hypothetical protein
MPWFILIHSNGPNQNGNMVSSPNTTGALGPQAFQVRIEIANAIELLAGLTEQEIVAVLMDGPLDQLLRTIAPLQVDDRREGELIYDYLLRHKAGLALLASTRRAITEAYGLEGSIEGNRVYVSPDEHQWFDNGVMFLQGEERFGGLLGLYRNGKISFGVSARDTLKGEAVGPDDLVYIELEEYRRLAKERFRVTPGEIDSVSAELKQLIESGVAEESRYQQWLENHPWAFGAQYSAVQSHARLDDQNIPDFSGVRVRDGSRDILEIKSPHLTLFRANGEFATGFNSAWNQCERYLDFARQESGYLLRQRELRFENPRCYLVAGRNLTQEQLAAVRAKERMNPAITFLTYNDLQTIVDGTVAFIKALQKGSHSV